MTKTRFITATLTAIILSTGAAMASDPVQYADDPIVSQISGQLADQGYVIVDIEKSFLGRYVIEAVANGYKREIVIAAGSGQVLKDEWHAVDQTSTNGLDTNHDGILDEGVEIPETESSDVSSGIPEDDETVDDTQEDDSGDSATEDDSGDDNASSSDGGDDSGQPDEGESDDGEDDDNGSEDSGNPDD